MTDGLFRDDDLIRVITREGVLIAAGGVASLLQTAHPKVAQGVYDHSYTAENPLRRLQNTMGWLYAVQFGTRDEAERFSALVRKGHEQITGPDYEANDPELQVWVAATLFAVSAQFYQALFRRSFSDAEFEEYYRQTKVYATILGCPEERLPATYADFRVYYAEMVRSLRITDASRAIAEQVLSPKTPAGPLGAPGLAMVRLITAGMMPAPIREQYGWTWNAGRERRFRLLMGALATVYPRLPLRVRTMPREYYLMTTRRTLAKLAGQRNPVLTVKTERGGTAAGGTETAA
ncbi:oxygenase MpaB family protein [Spirillospora sp. NPDC047279]|uniref:oxygenase MpaB family protein n=1 Tax=Spirillospora sp. NPDC047279 TaxID=3155478 RepID=UPI0033EEF43B